MTIVITEDLKQSRRFLALIECGDKVVVLLVDVPILVYGQRPRRERVPLVLQVPCQLVSCGIVQCLLRSAKLLGRCQFIYCVLYLYICQVAQKPSIFGIF